jgi:hypothetical protein
MSMRTKLPRAAASTVSASRFSRQTSGESFSPSPVSFTETFASSPSRSIVSKTSWYAPARARVSSTCVISSPRTSTVASFPAWFAARTTVTASASSGPAM